MEKKRTVDFEFDIDDVVILSLTGEKGIVSMLGVDESGPTYYVKTWKESNWWKAKFIAIHP